MCYSADYVIRGLSAHPSSQREVRSLSHSRARMLSGMFDRILIQNELFKRALSFVNLVLFLRLRERALAIPLFPRLDLAQLM